jgi:MFS family permease
MLLTIARSTVTPWRGLPSTVWLLVAARAVNRLGAFTLPFLTVTLVQDFGVSLGQAGLLLAALGVATIPSRLLGGRLADRWGGRTTIVVGLAGTAIGQLMVAGARSLTEVAIAVALLGLAFEVYEPPSQSIIADVSTAEQRPVAYGLLSAALAAAGMGAGLLAAALASIDLRWLFVADAATCLVCAALVAALLPGVRPSPRDGRPDARAWSDRRLLAMLLVGTTFAVIYLQITIALPLTLTARGLGPSSIGLLLTASAATVVLCYRLLAHPWLRALDDFAASTLGYLVLAAGLLATGFVTSLPAFLVATVLWSVGDVVLMGRAYTIVAGLAPATARGRYLAVYGTSWGVAAIVAPVLGTQLLASGGPELTWTCITLVCLVLAGVQPALRRRLA